MFINSPIPSVSHPGYTHPVGTEATLEQTEHGDNRLLTLTVRGEPVETVGEDGQPSFREGDVLWTEQFLLPLGMKHDPKLPRIVVPSAQPKASFIVEDGKVVGLQVAVPDPTSDTGIRFQRFALDQIDFAPGAMKPPEPPKGT